MRAYNLYIYPQVNHSQSAYVAITLFLNRLIGKDGYLSTMSASFENVRVITFVATPTEVNELKVFCTETNIDAKIEEYISDDNSTDDAVNTN